MSLPTRSPHDATLRVTLRNKIWRVAVDGVFYGDYRAEAGAVEGAEAAAASLRAHGRVVTIVGPPGAI